MCGIVAYNGKREALPILLHGLHRLEYRGYDSSGIAVVENDHLVIHKKEGRIANLEKELCDITLKSHIGISHTRWATHGEPNDCNAHPHSDNKHEIAVVHNGVIENHTALRTLLEERGSKFTSTTDTEVFAHLISHYYKDSKESGSAKLKDAVQKSIGEVRGTFGIAVIHKNHPNTVIAARRGSPLVLGLGEDEIFLASDANAIIDYTSKVVFLQDYDIVEFDDQNFSITSFNPETLGAKLDPKVQKLEQTPYSMDKGTFPHFMLKEIFEQPQSIENAFRGRFNEEKFSAHLGGLNLSEEQLRDIQRIFILGCGTALHAGKTAEYMIEAVANLPVETDDASEFRYRHNPIDKGTVFFAVSQSGETADTLAALREAKRKGFPCLGICNAIGSSIARESDGGTYIHSGPEIAVAATKSFTSKLTVFALLALLLGRTRFFSAAQGAEMIEAIKKLPQQVTKILQNNDHIQKIAQKYVEMPRYLCFGRLYNFPLALETALKIKEITYKGAEGYPSSELKHGIIALVDKQTPSIFFAPKDSVYEKNANNMSEVKARGGQVIAVTTEGNEEIKAIADDVIYVPQTLECLQPILNIIPMQLFAYHTAVALGRDVDKPRNLAKSVTVE